MGESACERQVWSRILTLITVKDKVGIQIPKHPSPPGISLATAVHARILWRLGSNRLCPCAHVVRGLALGRAFLYLSIYIYLASRLGAAHAASRHWRVEAVAPLDPLEPRNACSLVFSPWDRARRVGVGINASISAAAAPDVAGRSGGRRLRSNDALDALRRGHVGCRLAHRSGTPSGLSVCFLW